MRLRIHIAELTPEQRHELEVLAADGGWVLATPEAMPTLKTLHGARYVDRGLGDPPSHRITNAGRRALGPECPRPAVPSAQDEEAAAA